MDSQPRFSASGAALGIQGGSGNRRDMHPTNEGGVRQVGAILGYRVLSIKLAASFAGVSVAHLHRAAKGQLPGTASLRVFRVGRRVLTRTDWLDEWMRAAAYSDDAGAGGC